jgi:MoaA/NifB/PqqE/SkfB family radical SAM enzyme
MINITVSSSCQLSCTGCRGGLSKTFLKKMSTPRESFISDKIFKNIVDRCIQSGIVCFDLTPAIGDPFLDPTIYDKLDYLESSNDVKMVIMSTNLIWHDEAAIIRLLSYSKICLQISIYGTYNDDYIEVTKVNQFQRFYHNLRLVYKSLQKLNLQGWIILSNRTKYTTPESFPKTDVYFLLKLFERDFGIAMDYTEVFNMNRGGSIHIPDNDPLFRPAKPTRNWTGMCPSGPGSGGGVLPNGDVVFCPLQDIYRTGVVGNIFDKTLTEIYKDEPFQRLITNQTNNIFTGICETCNEVVNR